MTVPEERTRAVVRTRDFLRELTSPLATPRVPRQVRNRAAALLRHFPQDFHLERAAHHCPESWGWPGEHLEFSNVGRRYPKPKVKSLDAFAGSLQAIRHVKIEQMNPLRDRNVEELLTSIAELTQASTSEELEELLRECAPMADQLRLLFEFLSKPEVRKLMERR